MRISSQQVFSGGINRLQDLNSQLQQTQQQISSGKKVNTPSDDPVAAARILKLNQESANIKQFQNANTLAENRLNQEESALASAIDVIQRVRELTVQAGNSSLSPADRQSVAAELKEKLEQLVSIANTRDASGEYIFSGFKGDTQAFAKNVSGNYVYQGDEGQRSLELDVGVKVPISDHGKDLFVDVASSKPTFFAEASSANQSSPPAQISTGMVLDQGVFNSFYNGSNEDLAVDVYNDNGTLKYGVRPQSVEPPDATSPPNPSDPSDPAYSGPYLGAGDYSSGESITFEGIQFELSGAEEGDRFEISTYEKQSVFTTVEKLIYGLENSGSVNQEDLVADSLANLDNAQEKILKTQTEIGGRLNTVDSTRQFLEDSSVFTEKVRSELQDVDYAEAVSNLSFQSFVLQAAQQSFAQVSRLSLFDRL